VDRPDEYGYDGYIAQGASKEAREKDPNVRGPIIGNWKHVEPKGSGPEKPKFVKPKAEIEDDIPW
jgi:hypothetical protein